MVKPLSNHICFLFHDKKNPLEALTERKSYNSNQNR